MKSEAVMHTLFDCESYRVDYFAAPQATEIVVTFSERTARSLLGFGFGGGFMLNEDVSLISVKGNRDTWYQDFPDEAVLAIRNRLEEPDLRHLPRASYGSSMGAYAAIAFSGALGITRILALSPLVDVHLPWDERWQTDVQTFQTLSRRNLAADAAIVVAYDPFDLDAKHAAMIADIGQGQVVLVPVPHCGHPVTSQLHQAGCLKSLALAVFKGAPLPTIAHRLKTARRFGTHYLFVLALRCKERHRPRWAYALIEEALKLRPLDPEYNIQASIIAESLGFRTEAARFAALAVAAKPTHIGMLAHLAKLLGEGGYTESALVWINRAIQIDPTNPGLLQLQSRLTS